MSVLLDLPPAPRPRIHSVSTGYRPPLSIATLARSHANSFCQKHPSARDPSEQSSVSLSNSTASSYPCSEPAFVLPPLQDPKARSDGTPRRGIQNMLPVVVTRTVDLWRAIRSGDGKHTTSFFSSPRSSPRSSMETDYILPLSASPQKTAFDTAELDVPSRSAAHYRLTSFPSGHASLFFVIILFPISSAVVFLSLSTLPITFAWPSTLSDLARLGRDLSTYSRSGFVPTAHIVGVLAVSAVWKHAWSVPGSVLWNVLAGALFHPLLATLLMTVLTSVGSVFATLLATPLAPVLTRVFPRPVELTRAALEGSSISSASDAAQSGQSKNPGVTSISTTTSPAWVRLSVLRLVGVVPWSALNIACGLTGVALSDCIVGAFIGSLPWTAVTCQIGNILQVVNNASTAAEFGLEEGLSKTATVSSVLAQPSMILELVFLTVLSLAPILLRDRLRRLVPSSDEETVEVVKLEESEEKEMGISTRQKQRNAPLTVDEEDLNSDNVGRRGRRFHRQRWTWQRLSQSVPRFAALNSPLRPSFPKIERDTQR